MRKSLKSKGVGQTATLRERYRVPGGFGSFTEYPFMRCGHCGEKGCNPGSKKSDKDSNSEGREFTNINENHCGYSEPLDDTRDYVSSFQKNTCNDGGRCEKAKECKDKCKSGL